MERPGDETTPSAIGAGLLVLGDQWNLLILQQAFLNHVRRFGVWHAALGVSESVLSGRIRELVAAGLLEGAPYKENGRPRTEYRLTGRALELWSFLIAIWSWERSWVAIPHWPTDLLHLTCHTNIGPVAASPGKSASAGPELGCGACSVAPVTARDTAVRSGPDTTFRNVAVPRHHRRTIRDRQSRGPDSYLPDTLEILGDRWSTVLLVAAFLRVRRFADFSHELGIADGILSDRLRRFLELGVLKQTSAGAEGGRTDVAAAGATVGTTTDRRQPRVEYRLTPKGLAFFPVFAFLVDWAQRWYPRPVGGGLTITHQLCGQPLRPFLRCPNCHAPLARPDVRFVTGRPT